MPRRWLDVAELRNHRVRQVFDGVGNTRTSWQYWIRPVRCIVAAASTSSSASCRHARDRSYPYSPALSIDAKARASHGGGDRPASTGILAPYGTSSRGSRGDIYVGEVGVTDWKTSFPDTPELPTVKVTRCLQKLEKVSS